MAGKMAGKLLKNGLLVGAGIGIGVVLTQIVKTIMCPCRKNTLDDEDDFYEDPDIAEMFEEDKANTDTSSNFTHPDDEEVVKEENEQEIAAQTTSHVAEANTPNSTSNSNGETFF